MAQTEPKKMSTTPLISVVIATYNRCETLKATIEKLALQLMSPADFEVLVVDDGSTDDTAAMVESLISSMPYKLRYFWHENLGPGYTQNRGIKEADSNLVLLMADDIWATSEMLEQHLKSHKEFPNENIAILGKVIQSPDLPSTVMHKYWDPFRYDILDGKRQLDAIHFLACNISVKKNFLLENGLYRERKGAAHEDIELGYRLGQKGLKIVYNEDALAYHYHPETLDSACQRAYERGRNFDMLSENIPKSYIFPLYNIFTLQVNFWDCVKMLPREFIRKLLFNGFTVNSFWIPILNYAEVNPIAALFACGITYRGTIYYHMRLGYKDLKKRRNVSSLKTVITDFGGQV